MDTTTIASAVLHGANMVTAEALRDSTTIAAIDIVKKVQEMYEVQWTHLIFVVSVIIAIGTTIIPYFISLLQRKNFKTTEEVFKSEVTKMKEEYERKVLAIEEKLETTEKIFEKKMKDLNNDWDKDQDIMTNQSNGMVMLLQARIFEIDQNYIGATISYTLSASSFFKAEMFSNFDIAFASIKNLLELNIFKDDFDNNPKYEGKFREAFKELVECLTGKDQKGRYQKDVEELNDLLEAAKKKEHPITKHSKPNSP